MRRKLLMGNWKMNKTIAEAKQFAIESHSIAELAEEHNIDLGVAPTYLSLEIVKKHAAKSMKVASQNVHFATNGAFTGEISIQMLKEIGVEWSLVGHSERRTYDGETDQKCNDKVLTLLDNGMTPIFCCGESLEIFQNGQTKSFVEHQIREGLKNIPLSEVGRLVVAYEPIWSIGTGHSASKEIAEEMCSFIREVLRSLYGTKADEIRILYGGSVKPENIKEYLSCPNVDGALVGGASLKIDSYRALLENIL